MADKTKAAQPAATQPQTTQKAVSVFEEDDEFEEFENETWTKAEEEDESEAQWAEDWDDEQVDDDFSKQLRAELEKQKAQPMKTD